MLGHVMLTSVVVIVEGCIYVLIAVCFDRCDSGECGRRVYSISRSRMMYVGNRQSEPEMFWQEIL